MDETPQKKIIGRPFEKGNKLSANRKNTERHYTTRAREFIETKGWDKLEKWAQSQNYKASIAALTTILAYAYGKPREQIKFESNVPVSVQQWFLNFRAGAVTIPGTGHPGLPAPGPDRPLVVHGERPGDNGVAGPDGHNPQHTGTP